MRKSVIASIFAIALVLALGLVACGSSSPQQEDPAKAEYDRACALFDEGKFYSAKVAFESSEYDDWEARAAECVQSMPATGKLWQDSSLENDDTSLTFTVADSDEGVGRYIAVYTDQKELAATVFIQGTGSVTMNLLGGNYYIKDASGTEWYGDAELFGDDGYYETMVFEEFEDDRFLTAFEAGYAWEITINTSSGDGQDVASEEGDWDSWD